MAYAGATTPRLMTQIADLLAERIGVDAATARDLAQQYASQPLACIRCIGLHLGRCKTFYQTVPDGQRLALDVLVRSPGTGQERQVPSASFADRTS